MKPVIAPTVSTGVQPALDRFGDGGRRAGALAVMAGWSAPARLSRKVMM